MAVATHARPGRPKSDEKRQAILDAASDLFMSDGYERASMDAIAADAGVSKQTVYSHFGGKEDLFRQCIHAKIHEYGLYLDGVAADVPLTTVLRTMGHRFLDLLCDPSVIRMHRLLIAETDAFPQLAQTYFESGPQATIASLATFLAKSELKIDTPEQAASDFLCLIKGHYLTRLLVGCIDGLSEAEKDEHVERCIRQFMCLYCDCAQPA